MRLGALVELLGVQEQRLRRQRRPLRVAAHQPVALAGVLPEMLEGGLELAVQHHGGVGAAGSRRRSRFLRRTAAGSTRCRRWRRRCPCPCRCGCASGRLRAVRASGCESARGRRRPSGTRGPAAGALRAPGRGCAGCRGRRCGSSRSRRRTGRRGRAPASPSGTGRSGRRAPRTRRGSRPASRGCSRPA